MRRVHIEVSGRVQGVFYRATCAERARELGLGGWVRNGSSGRVEAEFEGDEQGVETIVAWCRIGPPMARVDSVQVPGRASHGGARVPRHALTCGR